MKQLRLHLNTPVKKPVTSQRSGYDAHNLECARLMLLDPEHYVGIQLDWAKTVVEEANCRIARARALPGR
jgi:hypothetical protein